MISQHRPFHRLAMSDIIPPMVPSAGLHITSPIPSISLYQRMGNGRQTGNPAVMDDFMWLAMAGSRFKQGRA